MSDDERTAPELADLPHDPEARLDQLGALTWKARSGQVRLNPADARALAVAMRTETDDLIRVVLWELIELAPYRRELEELAEAALGDARSEGRGEALTYLLAHRPDRAGELLGRHGEDDDPYVRDAIARFLETRDPRRAVRLWMEILAMPDPPQELAETIPLRIAPVATEDELRTLRDRAREHGLGSTWQYAADSIRPEFPEKAKALE